MEPIWSNIETMRSETEKCYSEIDGIQEFYVAQNIIYRHAD